jgi:predicted O-linked N-acetylglucosamine transferase (SPINDLY family)
MRIAFVDFIPYSYTIESAYQEPLGGSQSALCYLAEVLARYGHEIFLFTTSEIVTQSRGVVCMPLKVISAPLIHSLQLDVLVLLNVAAQGPQIRELLQPQTRLAFWTGHAHNQPGVQSLSDLENQAAFDYIVVVSDWQRDCYIQAFGISPQKLKVLKNAISPSFNSMFATNKPIIGAKSSPPVLAYTSTPFRGLELLLEIFPRIRQAVPGTRLKIFSSMQVYQVSPEQDQYQHLYQQLQQIEGVEYIGSLTQSKLAGELQSITALAYPNSFPETSCIAVMEAMASGCLIITSDLGALSETTAGFADLVPVSEEDQDKIEAYKAQFVETAVAALQKWLNQSAVVEQRLQAQVSYVNEQYTWEKRAEEWEEWLTEISTPSLVELIAAEIDWEQQVQHYLDQKQYQRAINIYEQKISEQPEEMSYYWTWGILLILVGREDEANLTWSMVLSGVDSTLYQQLVSDLVLALQKEAKTQEVDEKWQLVWILRYSSQEYNPTDLKNLLALILCSIRLENLSEHEILLEQTIALLESSSSSLQTSIFAETLQQLLQHHCESSLTLEFAQACLQFNSETKAIQDVISSSTLQLVERARKNLAFSRKPVVDFLKLCLNFSPDNLGFLSHVIGFSPELGDYQEAIEKSEYFLELATDENDQVGGYYLYLRSLLLSGGQWQKAQTVSKQYFSLIERIADTDLELNSDHAIQLMKATAYFSYLEDDLAELHRLRKKICNYSLSRVKNRYADAHDVCSSRLRKYQKKSVKKLKIGYLSSCFMCHSVGYLARWIFKYHDYENFDIHAYSLVHHNDFIQQFIADNVTAFVDLSEIKDPGQIAQIISKDEVDILIDLDSITFGQPCIIMALKPAPIQVTWLGFDAIGLSTVDYFLADPYVLSMSAEKHYTEKIWRLPQTYIAVDGFELTVPSLRREDLKIPEEAIIYYTSQGGAKRHPHTTRLQLEILKQVENSYLLIKGVAEESSVQSFFRAIATEVGVSEERLRFLPYAPSPEAHRANMTIADVVLDTYPYNGATTTLETLWMGVPLVTRVGEQFAARNSYGFLVNVGVSEGIAWTDDEYVEWGVRFGNDPQLRQDVAWKLRASRQTSPLWNAKKFTLELEKAFRQMWETY